MDSFNNRACLPNYKNRMTIAVDFDGTIVEHRYPAIGPELPFARETVKRVHKERQRRILWTVREGRLLDEAGRFWQQRGLTFYAINSNYPEESPLHATYTRKLQADLFIDDRNLGGLPDWGIIYRMVHEGLTFEELRAREALEAGARPASGSLLKRFFKKNR